MSEKKQLWNQKLVFLLLHGLKGIRKVSPMPRRVKMSYYVTVLLLEENRLRTLLQESINYNQVSVGC